MFHDHLIKLLKDLHMEGAEVSRDLPSFSLDLDGTIVELTDSPPGLELFATVGDVPEEGQEELFIKLLRANFLGQAAQKSCLGLDAECRHVIISSSIPAIRSYREFRDSIEDFLNAVSFWKSELAPKT